MIDLTPLEVRKKKGDFRKAMRGYESQAVDDFLDLVADRLEQLVRENAALQERISSVTTQVSDYRERERALTEALVTAQEMREQMRQQVEREVELKLREAEADAEQVRTTVAQMREREEENIRRLRARQSQFVQSYRGFLEREIAELSVMMQTLDMSAEPEETPPPRKRARKEQASAPPQTPPPTPAPEPIPMPLPVAELELPLVEDASTSEPEISLDAFEEPQHELIDLSQHFPPTDEITASYVTPDAQTDVDELPRAKLELEDEVPELELLEPIEDETPTKKKDEDSDGWVSSLLEGKGD